MLGGQPASVCHTYCKSMNTKKDSKIPNSNFNEITRKAMRIDAAWLKEIHTVMSKRFALHAFVTTVVVYDFLAYL